MPRILITGGTGLIGQRITSLLHSRGISVAYLSRNPDSVKGVPAYHWNPNDQLIDPACLDDTVAIINLAGAGIADKRWTAERKAAIMHSRTRSAAILFKLLSEYPNKVKTVISASAIGYYGNQNGELKTEESKSGNDFLSEVTVAWENAIDSIKSLDIRLVKIRIGIVLSMNGGALEKLAKPIQWWLGAPLGSGKQFMSWIHIDDLCEMFIYAYENEYLEGVFNGVGPDPLTNEQLTREVAKTMKKPLFLPNVPAKALKILLGEMAVLILGGAKVSSRKIEESGFNFQYRDISTALLDLLH